MTLRRLWTFLAVALPALAAVIGSLSSVDLAYHLRAGGEILDTRAIPTVDTFTFTVAGQSWTDQQWFAQVVLAAVYRVGGWTGLVLLRAALVAAIFGCLYAVARRRGLTVRMTALVTLAAFVVSAPALALRPQLLAMALFALTLLLVEQRRRHPRWLWAVPVLVVVWANTHGSFFIAPLVVGLAWLEDVHDRRPGAQGTLAVAVVCALAAAVNPAGPGIWVYAASLSSSPTVTSRITEWQPTSIRDVAGTLYFASVIAVAALIARRGASVPWPTLAWLGTFLVIGAYAERGVAWWGLAAVPAVASLLPAGGVEPAERSTPGMHRLNVVLAGLIVLGGVVLLPVFRPLDTGTGVPTGVVSDAPLRLTAAIRDAAKPGDRLLNPQEWGSWFELAIPAVPVAVDSRIELIPADTWNDYEIVLSGGDGWQEILARWQVTIAALPPDDLALADRLTAIGWTKVFGDDAGSSYRAP